MLDSLSAYFLSSLPQLALRLFTCDVGLPDIKFHQAFNEAHRANDRTKATPFLRYTWLLLWAVREPVAGAGDMYIAPRGCVVYRGVSEDLRDKYGVGSEPAWHEFSSTSDLEAVAYGFVETALPFTIFEITLTTSRACRIWDFSEFAGEREVLLPPGTRFRVTAVTVMGNESRIHMEELPPYEAILEYGDFIPDVYGAVSVSLGFIFKLHCFSFSS